MTIFQVRAILCSFDFDNKSGIDEVRELSNAKFDRIFDKIKRKYLCDYYSIIDKDLIGYIVEELHLNEKDISIRVMRGELANYLTRKENKRFAKLNAENKKR